MPMNQQGGFAGTLKNLLNDYSPAGIGYKALYGSPMFNTQMASGMQGQGASNMNQLGSPSFQNVPAQEGNWFSGYNPQVMTSSPFTGNQQNMMNMLGQMGMQGLQTGQMPGGISFDPIRQQAMTQFNTQTVPSLAERFTSMGGGQRSSAFQGALGQAGAGLYENLGAMESQFKAQMMPMLMQMMNAGLRPQYQQQMIPAQGGFGQQAASGVASMLPYLPFLFM